MTTSEPERHDLASLEVIATCSCGEQIVTSSEASGMSLWETHATLALFERIASEGDS